MHNKTIQKICMAASLAIFTLSCNNAEKNKEAKEQTAGTTDSPSPSAAENTETTAIETTGEKCFTNEGLKYATSITINFTAGKQVTGKVSSTELGTGEKQVAKFSGTYEDGQLMVQFAGTAPIIGAASEWTSKPWKLDNSPDKEKLLIIFNAKNYDTNQWGETEYTFAPVPCK